jgi:hypothetical protein
MLNPDGWRNIPIALIYPDAKGFSRGSLALMPGATDAEAPYFFAPSNAVVYGAACNESRNGNLDSH